MPRKLTLIKGGSRRGILVYGMRMFQSDAVAGVDPARVAQTDGTSGTVTMHLIEGTRIQVRRQLMRSVDAFFELLEEE